MDKKQRAVYDYQHGLLRDLLAMSSRDSDVFEDAEVKKAFGLVAALLDILLNKK